jgi:dolichol kinase
MQNVINAYTLSFVILSVFTLAAYLIHILKKKQLMNVIPIIASIVTVYLIYGLIAAYGSPSYYDPLALDICIAIISTITAILYITKPYIFIGLIILLVAGFVIYSSSYGSNTAFAGMFAIGTIYGLMYREFALNPKKSNDQKKMKKKEINRDLIQIFLGIILVGIVMLFPYFAAVSMIFALILLAYTSNNLLANLRMGRFYTRAMDLERKGVTYGQGATYLAASTALIMGFVYSTNALLFGIIVLFFADSFATIVGVSLRRAEPLPYNRGKTMVGTLAFLAISAIGGYMTLGLYGVLFAVILSFIEGLNISIDDNIRSGVILVILKALAGI